MHTFRGQKGSERDWGLPISADLKSDDFQSMGGGPLHWWVKKVLRQICAWPATGRLSNTCLTPWTRMGLVKVQLGGKQGESVRIHGWGEDCFFCSFYDLFEQASRQSVKAGDVRWDWDLRAQVHTWMLPYLLQTPMRPCPHFLLVQGCAALSELFKDYLRGNDFSARKKHCLKSIIMSEFVWCFVTWRRFWHNMYMFLGTLAWVVGGDQ